MATDVSHIQSYKVTKRKKLSSEIAGFLIVIIITTTFISIMLWKASMF